MPSSSTQYANEWEWLYYNKTLFLKTDLGLDLACSMSALTNIGHLPEIAKRDPEEGSVAHGMKPWNYH